MKYPLMKGERNWFPRDFVCPVCGKTRVWEPHTFVTIDAGALLMDRKTDSGGPSDAMDGFLSLGWHGAHDNGVGKFRETGGYVPIADDVRGGQCSIAVCSTACLRKLLRGWVEELEKRMRRARPRRPTRRTRATEQGDAAGGRRAASRGRAARS